jgi:hypothetical protein
LRGLTDPHLWFAYPIGVLVTLARDTVAGSEVYVGGAGSRNYPAGFHGGLEPRASAKR